MQRTAPDPDAIKEAARMLLAAKNPVLWAGQGIHYAEAGDLLAALAELLPAPVVATNPGKSAIPDSHPLALGGFDPLALEDVHRVHGQGRRGDGDRLEPDEIELQSQHAARQDR